ncbi:hypothetical protein ON010_g1005 [Phytophthora cinnamomi]|nr:hypothetical protein ON010_g1005 [Phytophthora cinnamomi]
MMLTQDGLQIFKAVKALGLQTGSESRFIEVLDEALDMLLPRPGWLLGLDIRFACGGIQPVKEVQRRFGPLLRQYLSESDIFDLQYFALNAFESLGQSSRTCFGN